MSVKLFSLLLSFMLATTQLTGFSQGQFSDEAVAHFHEFDFWIGEWNVYKFGTDTLVGKSRIESINDGMAILENYQSTKGPFKGKSLNKYHVRNDEWQQFWVDNGGMTLFLRGGLKEGKMVMSEKTSSEKGTTINRITWEPMPNKEVRQSWDLSSDDGNTWQRLFDGIYKRE